MRLNISCCPVFPLSLERDWCLTVPFLLSPVRRRLLPTSLPVLPSFRGRIRLDRRGGWLEFLVPHPHPAVRGQTDEVDSRGAQRPGSMSRAVAPKDGCSHHVWVPGGVGVGASRSQASVTLKSCVLGSLWLLYYGLGTVDQTQVPVKATHALCHQASPHGRSPTSATFPEGRRAVPRACVSEGPSSIRVSMVTFLVYLTLSSGYT